MEKIGIKYGLFTAAALIIYFVLMHLLGLTHITELRFLNGLILAVGITIAIKSYKHSVNGNISYFKGLGTGIMTAIVGTTLFAVFMVIYINIAGAELLETLSAEQYFGQRINTTPGIVIFAVLMLEGVISGVLISFIAMQFFKRKDMKVPGSP
ncbi:DUF4199 domain-containing protein [Pontibacter sp. 172403-2]|uniref:DUF4199 domain-containing protein n=1 Tax=Pontibacter rufus TaxID=2791028 RepID=UPI0018AF9FC0|nr:DUF4199 domain-containing protein [Pontibacter sp. 172403-2]MBF9254759.1 DUF4199 domain-containing protein [Pontibacter sp. 172403-2]